METDSFLDNRLTDGNKTYASAALYSPETLCLYLYFSYRLGKPQGLVRPLRLSSMKKFIQLIGSRARDQKRQ
jgi:hypothetical protein